jgi:endonuclease YncB( thermonuclease family)
MEGSIMNSAQRHLALATVVFAFMTGCALKPIAVTGKEGDTANGQQSETSFSVNRVNDGTTITVTYNDGTDAAQCNSHYRQNS